MKLHHLWKKKRKSQLDLIELQEKMRMANTLPVTATKSWRLVGRTLTRVLVSYHLLVKVEIRVFCAGAR